MLGREHLLTSIDLADGGVLRFLAAAVLTTALTTGLATGLAACGAGQRSGQDRGRADGPPVTLAFAGDVHFEGSARPALSGGLAAITPALSRADLTVVNLETAVTTRGERETTKAFTFRATPTAFRALKRSGVDVVTMANNHALDYGQVGLADSLAASRTAGLPVVGAGVDEDAAFAPYVATVKGRRIAVLGATQVLDDNLAAAWTAGPGKAGLASAKDEDRLTAAVRAARAAADVVVVDLHWGTELVSCPTTRQRELAARLAGAGADVIVGSHAHVLLGGGWAPGGAYVHYGLGNFVWYARTAQTQATGVLTLTVTGRRVGAATWTPARIRSGMPTPLTGGAAARARAAEDRLRGCTGLAGAPVSTP
jgi:poly-gamma-glutamate synthesis protein (capsule biosynthesis protein)